MQESSHKFVARFAPKGQFYDSPRQRLGFVWARSNSKPQRGGPKRYTQEPSYASPLIDGATLANRSE